MNMITRKKLIAALLIPIILIAFSTPSFAASSTGVDIQGFANKALEFIMEIGGVSLDIAKDFAGQFMDVNGLNDVIERIPDLATTGFSAIGDLVGVFTSTNFTSITDALKIIPKLLKFVVNTGIDFCNIIFPGYGFDLANPSSFFKFATELFGFAVESGKTLADVVLDNVDLNDIGDLIGGLINGSTGDLSGIFNTLLPSGNAQIPSLDLNFDKNNLIQLLGSVTGSMGGPIGDLLGSGMDIVGGILDSFTKPDTNIPQLPSLDNDDVDNNDNVSETPNNTKPDITTPPANTDLTEYQYTNDLATYKLAVLNSKLIEARRIISDKAINSNNEAAKNLDSKDIASYYVYIMTKSLNSVSLDGVKLENYNAGTGKYGEIANLKAAIDEFKPAVVRIDESYWVTCVGYKNNGSEFSDFLFIDSKDGNIKPAGNTISNFYSKIRTNAIYTF